jgi:hypothetical protein
VTPVRARFTLCLLLLGGAGCEQRHPQYQTPATGQVATAPPASSSLVHKDPHAPLSREEFAHLVESASEKGEYFFSDNLISNETAYLKPAGLLAQTATTGGAYIGVGPEQNFSYIALVHPSLAFVVDIRRDNLLEQLWYKALFELAATRSEFLCLMLGREWNSALDPGRDATLTQVLDTARKAKRSQTAYDAAGRRIEELLGQTQVALRPADLERIGSIRKRFFEKQLDLRFALHGNNAHRYPTLERMLSETDSGGKQRSFLASEAAFREVQRLQRANRVVPVVGNFAGSQALGEVAREIRAQHLVVSLFYVSNVEQYLFEGQDWQHWVENLRALPTDEKSLIARVHLDQGKPHPKQLRGHRSTTVLQRFDQFFEHQQRRPYRNAWQLVTEDLLVIPD